MSRELETAMDEIFHATRNVLQMHDVFDAAIQKEGLTIGELGDAAERLRGAEVLFFETVVNAVEAVRKDRECSLNSPGPVA